MLELSLVLVLRDKGIKERPGPHRPRGPGQDLTQLSFQFVKRKGLRNFLPFFVFVFLDRVSLCSPGYPGPGWL